MAIPITNKYGRELEKEKVILQQWERWGCTAYKERNNCQCYNQEDGGPSVKLAGKKPEVSLYKKLKAKFGSFPKCVLKPSLEYIYIYIKERLKKKLLIHLTA